MLSQQNDKTRIETELILVDLLKQSLCLTHTEKSENQSF